MTTPAAKTDARKGALDVHVDRRTRKQHLEMIRYAARTHDETTAMRYWLTHCPRISQKAAFEAMHGAC